MNNKGTKESVMQKRGFYIALYGVLAALLVLAAVISYNNYVAVRNAREMRAQIAAEELQAVSANRVPSYRSLAEARTTPPAVRTTPTAPGITATPVPRPAPRAPAAQQEQPVQPAPPAQPEQTAPSAEAGPPPAPGASPPPAANPAPDRQSEAAPDPSPSPSPARGESGGRTSQTAPPIVEVFTEGDLMRWPVLGEVVMDFSADRLIFDRTLEQFRTNAIMCIATDIGTPVHAATGGRVVSVTHSREMGNTIVLDHGNGWTTSYSQLQDGVLVRPGDVVTSGQVIGGVGAPTLYYVLLGSHLGFAVAHNDVHRDPTLLLE